MSEFPKWLLALAALSLIPTLCCPLFLFGGKSLGSEASGFVSFLLYLVLQALWIVPAVSFFVGLDAWRRGYEKRGVIINVLGLIVSIIAFVIVLK